MLTVSGKKTGKKSSLIYFKDYMNIIPPSFIFISFEEHLDNRFYNYLKLMNLLVRTN